eukprot:GFUD01066752.1.p1 GENE.GFUD01066752.1~~GFUD01066752.1.p1  ORF type:complete len:212 (-),score=51.51 GFUD01066752.1:110-745(-)
MIHFAMSNSLSTSAVIILLVSVMTTNSKSPSSDSSTFPTSPENKTSDPSFTNKVAPSDSYSMYKHLMEVKDNIIEQESEPEVVKTVKTALQTLFEAALKGLVSGFLPHVERQRREATDDTRTYLDIIMNTIGALLGRQECSEIIACRTGKFVGHKVPGASLGVMMIEGIVPKSLSSWFGVVKTAVIDRSDQDCDQDYQCSLVEDEENEDEW